VHLRPQARLPFLSPHLSSRRLRGVGLVAWWALLLAVTSGAASGPAHPAHWLLLDGAVSGPDVVAVGERGVILRSADSARTWNLVPSGTTATLTAVSFANSTAPSQGWAVGHDAVILFTRDGGTTWTRQYQGPDLQSSFLDVLAVDAQRAIAVGSDGLYLATADGGRTWERRKVGAEDAHFNRITRSGSAHLFLAGERGTLLRSPDLGSTWQRLDAPYEGSFYGLLPLDRLTLLAHGLRGHVYRSADDGVSWQAVVCPQPVLLATAVRVRGDQIILAGQARSLLVSADLGRSVQEIPGLLAGGVARLLELPDGAILALGEAGATRLERSLFLPREDVSRPAAP
jgi:photosystem II stability/assembly factor-like uncharacterized protein